MAKRVNSAKLKGILDLDFSTGKGTITEIVKDSENEYDFFALLNEFNGKTIALSIVEENELPTTDEI